MARPTKDEIIAIKKRDDEILKMNEKGYPLEYIASYFNITKGRVVQIIKKAEEKSDAN